MQQESLTFEYPTMVDDLEKVRSLDELRSLMDQLAVEDNFKPKDFKYYQPCEQYLYARCRISKCTACLRYRLTAEGDYRLTTYRPRHAHATQKTRKEKFEAIKDYFAKLPPGVSITSLRDLVCRDFNVT
jgi:molybdenum cofactor biosynthesis enzyme MoaA